MYTTLHIRNGNATFPIAWLEYLQVCMETMKHQTLSYLTQHGKTTLIVMVDSIPGKLKKIQGLSWKWKLHCCASDQMESGEENGSFWRTC